MGVTNGAVYECAMAMVQLVTPVEIERQIEAALSACMLTIRDYSEHLGVIALKAQVDTVSVGHALSC